MATVTLHDGVLAVRFSPSEKILGLVRNLDVPVEAITGATAEQDGLAAVRGVRAPGLALPGRRKVGTWRGKAGRWLVAVDGHRPAVSIGLRGQRYDRVLVSVDDAGALVSALPVGM